MSDSISGRATSASDRVWRDSPPGTRHWLLHALPNSDVRTLLLDVAAARAERRRPSEVMSAWRGDRLSRPATPDPRLLSPIETALWAALPADFAGVELSPVAPLGSASSVTGSSQNRVVSTMRLGEVVSDSTNVLALEAAARRMSSGGSHGVHLATAQRQLRAQRFGPGAAQHFRLFALVSSARDTGSGRTEADLLRLQLKFWSDVLGALVPTRDPLIELTVWDEGAIRDRVSDTVLPGLTGPVGVVEDPARTRARGYYSGVALRLSADNGAVELGDGGLTTWTAQLTADRKERCLVSCASIEGLAALSRPDLV